MTPNTPRQAHEFVDFHQQNANPNVISRSIEEMISIENAGIRANIQTLFLGRNEEGAVHSSYYLHPLFPSNAEGPMNKNLWAHRGWLSKGSTGLISNIQKSLIQHPHLNIIAATTPEVAEIAEDRTNFSYSSYEEIIDTYGDFIEPYTFGAADLNAMRAHYQQKVFLLREGLPILRTDGRGVIFKPMRLPKLSHSEAAL